MKKTIIANWKMQLDVKESLSLLKKIKSIKEFKRDLIVCPDFLSLKDATDILKNKKKIKVGAQNCSFKEKGSLTGEVSPINIKELGAEYVIIGHSERRKFFKEDGHLINLKIKEAIKSGLKVILCVGESAVEKRNGRTRQALAGQLRSALKNLKIKKVSDLIIAYEPIWAIGSGKAMASDEANNIHKFLQDKAFKMSGKRFNVIYGGSVNVDNVKDFLKEKNVKGLLVGGASLDIKSLSQLINI